MSGAVAIARLLDTLTALEFIGAAHVSAGARCAGGDRWGIATPPARGAGRRGLAGAAARSDRECRRGDAARLRRIARRGRHAGRHTPAYRALRYVSRALEALYPLAAVLPTVSRFFLASDDLRRRPGPHRPADRRHACRRTKQANAAASRSMCRKTTTPAHAYPLVMALHGGSGHGRLFLWSWLREVRGRGVILVAPTAIGDTWSLMEPGVDNAHLAQVLDHVAQRWRVDHTRLLLTGMSDGGTFTLLSGLDDESPFTHLAPVAASFHPLLLTMAEPRRVSGLPIYLVHGALDWMFPVVDRANGAARADSGRSEGDVSRDRRSVARLSTRGGQRDPRLVRRRLETFDDVVGLDGLRLVVGWPAVRNAAGRCASEKLQSDGKGTAGAREQSGRSGTAYSPRIERQQIGLGTGLGQASHTVCAGRLLKRRQGQREVGSRARSAGSIALEFQQTR